MTARLAGCASPLVEHHDVALLDLDGVVYVGPDAVPGAAEALAAARDRGLRVVFVTNNASRRPETVAERLRGLGVPAAPEDVVTSAQAAARLAAERLPPGAAVLVVGADGLRSEIAAAGLRPVAGSADAPQAVVQGYATDTGYAELAEAALAVRAGALWIAANTDSTMPSPRGLLPGNGALVAAVAAATGACPLVAGKPALPLHEEAVRRSGATRPLVVGDRLDTDVEGAVAAGVPSLLVLTGVTTADELARAAPERRPSYLGADLGALLTSHPEVVAAPDGTARCGGWRAAVRPATDAEHDVVVERSAQGAGGGAEGTGEGGPGKADGEPADGLAPLRAAVVAAWGAADRGLAVRRVQLPDAG